MSYPLKQVKHGLALNLFDCLISPVALYASEFWLPYILPKKCFKGESSLFDFWENFKCEVINQRCCRMLLSVHKKTTRLAVIGELGRHPIWIGAMSRCLAYLTRRLEKTFYGPISTKIKPISRG